MNFSVEFSGERFLFSLHSLFFFVVFLSSHDLSRIFSFKMKLKKTGQTALNLAKALSESGILDK